jgi:hypothetical protein
MAERAAAPQSKSPGESEEMDEVVVEEEEEGAAEELVGASTKVRKARFEGEMKPQAMALCDYSGQYSLT